MCVCEGGGVHTCVCVCFREFQVDLEARLQRWGAEQCVGDVLLKLCSKLRVYSNYLNNYTTALAAIDKVGPPLKTPEDT